MAWHQRDRFVAIEAPVVVAPCIVKGRDQFGAAGAMAKTGIAARHQRCDIGLVDIEIDRSRIAVVGCSIDDDLDAIGRAGRAWIDGAAVAGRGAAGRKAEHSDHGSDHHGDHRGAPPGTQRSGDPRGHPGAGRRSECRPFGLRAPTAPN